MPKIRKSFAAISGAVIVLSLAACGSSKHAATTSTTTGPTGSATTAVAAGAPIKVGFMCSCTGVGLASNVPPEEVYKLWAAGVDAAGGINGHQVQVITEDDAATPATGLSEVQTLLADHVVAIVDNSVVDSAWASTVQAANVPVVGLITNGNPFFQNPDFYPEAQTNDSVLYAVVDGAKSGGGTSLATLYCAEAAQCAEVVPLVRAAGTHLGVPDSYNTSIAATQPNYTAQCLAAQQDHVNTLFVADASAVVLRVAADCSAQGYNPIYVGEGDGFGTSQATAPGLKTGTYIAFSGLPFYDTSNPVIQAIDAATNKAYPGLPQNASLWSENAVLAWSSGILLSDAIKGGGLTSSGTPTAAEVVTGLTSLHGDTLDGMAPPLTFVAGKPHLVDCWFTGGVKNGALFVGNNGSPTCETGASS